MDDTTKEMDDMTVMFAGTESALANRLHPVSTAAALEMEDLMKEMDDMIRPRREQLRPRPSRTSLLYRADQKDSQVPTWTK
jgi:hypothetical protein